MEATPTQRVDAVTLQRELDDRSFGMEVRSGIIMIIRAIVKRYKRGSWLLIVFGADR